MVDPACEERLSDIEQAIMLFCALFSGELQDATMEEQVSSTSRLVELLKKFQHRLGVVGQQT